MNPSRHKILIVEDNFDEQFLIKRALQKVLESDSTVNVVSGGDEAIAYMIGEGKFADREKYPFPTVLIADLNMSEGDGFDVLEFLQANPGWNVVPRVIFSSSDHDEDVRTAYLLGANAYHLKPAASSALENLMRDILEYWSSTRRPPVDETGRGIVTPNTGRRCARYATPPVGPSMKRVI